MKKLAILAVVLLLPCGMAWAQDGPDTPKKPGPQDDPYETALTPQEALEMMQQIYDLMGEAEVKLNDASKGEELRDEKDVIAKIEKLKKKMDDATATQTAILDKMDKLLNRSQKKQKTAIDKINELIRRCQKCKGGGKGQAQGKKQGEGSNPGKASPGAGKGATATDPYDPSRNDPANKFRSRADRFGQWGLLPPHQREAIMHRNDALEDFPPEFQELIKEYNKVLSEEDK